MENGFWWQTDLSYAQMLFGLLQYAGRNLNNRIVFQSNKQTSQK
jgi:hypothetical protein